MKQSAVTAFNTLCMSLLLGVGTGIGQQSRTYKEVFNVDEDVEVVLNTSYADIAFETWNRNEVSVEAVVTLEGASEEDANAFFGEQAVEIMGNSSRVEISTRSDNWAFRFNSNFDMEDFNFVIPDFEIPDIGPILENIEIPEMPEIAVVPDMPPMPPIPFKSFDYEAYEEEGEAYMKRWKADFDAHFDEEYKERMKEWAERAQERAKVYRERMEQREIQRDQLREQRDELRGQRDQQRDELRGQRDQQRDEHRRAMEEARAQVAEARERARRDGERSRVFFMRGDSGDREYTIKKKIIIKMPKGVRLKLNVRHGEVKLAENTRNLKADLSYARMLASSLQGEQTLVSARYSPIAVKAWDGGQLHADFSEDVQLSEVSRLDLSATSSDVTIDRILREASIRNNLGALKIGSVADDFKGLDISVQNGNLVFNLPKGAYHIRVQNRSSEVDYPTYIVWDGSSKSPSGLREGYHVARDSGRSIAINASYSDVKLHR